MSNPQRLDKDLTTVTVDAFKRVDCEKYVPCLEFAAGQGWPQFHCNSCKAYKPETMEEKRKVSNEISRLFKS